MQDYLSNKVFVLKKLSFFLLLSSEKAVFQETEIPNIALNSYASQEVSSFLMVSSFLRNMEKVSRGE